MSTRETRIGGIAAVIALTVISMSNHLSSRSPKAETYSVVSGAGPIRSARLRDLPAALQNRQARYPVRPFRASTRLASPLQPIPAPYSQLADALGLFRRAGTAFTQFIFPSLGAIPSTDRNFQGIGQGFSGPAGTFSVAAAPPDPNGDV